MSTDRPSAKATAAPPIRSWTDGYAALRSRAGDMRGWIELDTDAPDRRWPRTTGLDAIVIASFVDEAYRRTDPARSYGVALRWKSCKDDLERDALPALGNTYRRNRDFWSCLAMMFAHLAYVECPLPSQGAWRAFLAEVGATLATDTRNAPPTQDRPPVWFATAGDLLKLYLAQRSYAANLHGSDKLAPEADMNGGVTIVPRSTNGEVIQLAAFWAKALESEKSKNANGYDTMRGRMIAVQRDIDAHARGADPNAVYPKNHRFWRTIESVAIHVSASNQYGLTDAQVWMASVGESLQVMGERTKALATAIAASVRDGAADVVHGAGKILNEGARGLLGGLGTPLLIGGGIVAAFLLLRGRGDRERSS